MAQIKGTALLDTIKAIRARAGERELAKIVEQLNGEARQIFEGAISPSSWYSLDAFVEFLEADIRETAAGNREALIARSEKVIESQLQGIYRIFVKFGSPEFVIKRIAAVHATYFNGIHIIPEFEDGHIAIIKYTGFQKRHDIMEYAIIGFYRKALEISGAKEIAVKFTVPISEGSAYSELTITWA